MADFMNKMLDELDLMVPPVVVGSGMRLFDGVTDQVPLQLVQSRALSTGMLHLMYQAGERANSAPTGPEPAATP